MSDTIYAVIDTNVVKMMEAVIKGYGETNEDYKAELIALAEAAGGNVEVTVYEGEAYLGDVCLPVDSYEIVEPEEDIQDAYKRDNPNCLFI